MDHSNLVRKAWNATRKHKKLFWLGVIPTYTFFLFSGLTAQIAGLIRWLNLPVWLTSTSGFLSELQKMISPNFNGLEQTPEIGKLLLSFIFFLLFWLLNLLLAPAILYGLRIAEDQGQVTFGEIFRKVFNNFKPFLLLGFATLLISLTFTLLSSGSKIVFLCFLQCLYLPLLMLVSFFSIFILILIVFEELDLLSAAKRTWNYFLKPHFLDVVILFFIYGIVAFVLMLGILLLCLPLIGILYVVSSVGTASPLTTLVLILFYFPIISVAMGFVSVFAQLVWIEFYRKVNVTAREDIVISETSDAGETDLNGEG